MTATNIFIAIHELVDAVHIDAQTGEISLHFSDAETLEGFVQEMQDLLEQVKDE